MVDAITDRIGEIERGVASVMTMLSKIGGHQTPIVSDASAPGDACPMTCRVTCACGRLFSFVWSESHDTRPGAIHCTCGLIHVPPRLMEVVADQRD